MKNALPRRNFPYLKYVQGQSNSINLKINHPLWEKPIHPKLYKFGNKEAVFIVSNDSAMHYGIAGHCVSSIKTKDLHNCKEHVQIYKSLQHYRCFIVTKHTIY